MMRPRSFCVFSTFNSFMATLCIENGKGPTKRALWRPTDKVFADEREVPQRAHLLAVPAHLAAGVLARLADQLLRGGLRELRTFQARHVRRRRPFDVVAER